MPVIKKQNPKLRVNARKPAGIAARIHPVEAPNKGIRMNVYGRGKTGKTRFACTFPKPLLLVGTEDGTISVSNVKGIDFLRLQHSADLEQVVELCRAGGKYKSVVLDQATALQDVILQEILGLEDVPVQKSWGIAKQQDWGTCAMQMKQRLRELLSLAENDGIHLAIIAHERNFNDNAEASDVLFPTIGSALTPSVAGWLNGACDYICQTFIREQEQESEARVGVKRVTLRKKTGDKEYCLRVGPHPVYMTGFRLPVGVVLPEVIVDPSFDKVWKLIQGKGE